MTHVCAQRHEESASLIKNEPALQSLIPLCFHYALSSSVFAQNSRHSLCGNQTTSVTDWRSGASPARSTPSECAPPASPGRTPRGTDEAQRGRPAPSASTAWGRPLHRSDSEGTGHEAEPTGEATANRRPLPGEGLWSERDAGRTSDDGSTPKYKGTPAPRKQRN